MQRHKNVFNVRPLGGKNILAEVLKTKSLKRDRERRGGKQAERPHSRSDADREVHNVRCHKRRRNCVCRPLSLRLMFVSSDSLQPAHGDNEIIALVGRKRRKKDTEKLQK